MGGTLTPRRSRGFSLVEAMVSIVIVGLMATAVSRAIVDSRVALSNDEARNQATYKASRVIDSLRALGTSGVNCTPENQTGSGAPLEHVRFSAGMNCLPCSAPGDHVQFVCAYKVVSRETAVSGRVATRHVQVEVGWEIRKAPHTIHVEGVIE